MPRRPRASRSRISSIIRSTPSAEISPDGKRLAFLAPADNRLNVWICDAGAPLETAQLVTHEKVARDLIIFTWSRDGRWILYSHDANGDENFHIFRADPDQPRCARRWT